MGIWSKVPRSRLCFKSPVEIFFFRDTETTVNNLIVPGGAFTLSNTAFLSHETHAEKQALYPQLVHSYKWHDKVLVLF